MLFETRTDYLADITCTWLTYAANLRWNRVSNLERSGPEAGALPLGHHGPFLVFQRGTHYRPLSGTFTAVPLFGAREGKTFRQCEIPMKTGADRQRCWNSDKFDIHWNGRP
ncbi:hypothetical protein AVEN_17218-1 [Araneus ventricosus]|uniref:Uncharacterized protein n=1 Tax=Araneus ventricosus TaxID=182803 RepID=A0A4Y2A3U3_ARAVE|nr:hypothetical protein AVEN_17218-1 [Araneus ventricosus]